MKTPRISYCLLQQVERVWQSSAHGTILPAAPPADIYEIGMHVGDRVGAIVDHDDGQLLGRWVGVIAVNVSCEVKAGPPPDHLDAVCLRVLLVPAIPPGSAWVAMIWGPLRVRTWEASSA
jgi:hypothetical protein